MILPSANWRRTSCTTTPAVLDTALMASDEKMNAIEPPMSRPMNTLGSPTLMGNDRLPKSASVMPSCATIVSP